MTPNPITPDFDAVVERLLKDWHCPGLSLSVVHNDEAWSKGYGLTGLSPSSENEVKPTTLFYAASTTKAQLCAVWAIYMKSEANQSKPAEERITWSTPLVDIIGNDFVLEDAIRTRQVTLEDAVSHRTGMPRHDLAYGKEGPNIARDVTRHLRNLPLHTALRTYFEYCNTMYMAVTHALETLIGKHLSEIFREWLWQPLGMQQTYLGHGEAMKAVKEKGEVLAKSYYWTKLPSSPDYKDGQFEEQAWQDFPEISGAGEIISTADDYAKWMRCLLSSSSPLSEEMTKELWTPRALVTDEGDMQVPFDGNLLSYSLGWFVCSYRGYKCLYHPGGLIGAGSIVMIVPELKWGMSFFGNANDVGMSLRGLPFALLDKVIVVPEEKPDALGKVEDAVRKQYAKIDKAFIESRKKLYPNAPAKPQIPLTLPIEEYAGTYRGKAYGRVTFSVKEGDDGQKRLFFLADNRTWISTLTLEHVNAEMWLCTQHLAVSALKQASRAESKIGVDGKVEAFGLVMEGTMPEKLDWFKREG